MQRILTPLLQSAVCLAFALGLTAFAQDKKAEKTDASGTWTWTAAGRGGGEGRKLTLKLKADGDKLTGTMSAPNRQGEARETAIEDGKIKGDEITFAVTREGNNGKLVTKYSAKISGDTLKGKIETERDGQTRSRDWEAKRDGK